MASAPRLGVQSVVYADRSLADLLAELRGLPVERVELWDAHLAPGDGEDAVMAAEGNLADAGISVVGYGVIDLETVGEVRAYADLADRLGAEYLTVNYAPDRDDITEELLWAAEQFDLDVAIHNYSTVHHDDMESVFSTVDDVADVFERHDDSRLGACVDTGHFLVMDESPESALERLAGRVRAVHLKDTSEAELEELPGAGVLDLDAVVGLLADHDMLDVPLIIEYELEPARATDALREAVENVRGALDRKA